MPYNFAMDLANVNISAMDLANVNISAMDLANVNISAMDLANVNISAIDLANVDISAMVLANVDISGVGDKAIQASVATSDEIAEGFISVSWILCCSLSGHAALAGRGALHCALCKGGRKRKSQR
jgi:hypothetical protein